MNDHQGENQKKIIVITGLILVAAISRLLPHIDNFTPIGAMALFGGTYITNKRNALLLPMAALFLSDCMLQLFSGNGFHNTMIYVYSAFAIICSLGFLLRIRVQRQTIMVASLVGSIIFFLVTNFGVWTSGYYGYSFSGLLNCMIAGIPFFRGTVMGDLFFNLVLFGSFSIIRWRFPVLAK
jgi:hypothetical protein